MDDLFDIVEDETLSLDDSNNDDKNKWIYLWNRSKRYKR